MKQLEEKVDKLLFDELENAQKKFKPFNSSHEGYAVILEELEEGMEEAEKVAAGLAALWDCVRHNNDLSASGCAEDIYEAARKTACEFIQVAAMAQRYIKDIK